MVPVALFLSLSLSLSRSLSLSSLSLSLSLSLLCLSLSLSEFSLSPSLTLVRFDQLHQFLLPPHSTATNMPSAACASIDVDTIKSCHPPTHTFLAPPSSSVQRLCLDTLPMRAHVVYSLCAEA